MRRVAAITAMAAVAVGVAGGSATAATNNIFRVAGDGTATFGGDNGPATSAQLNGPAGVAATADGGYLIADLFNNRVRRVSPAGTITTVAGDGTTGPSGNNGPATAAQLNGPTGLATTADGGYLIADQNNHQVRRVSPGGTITAVAGTGTPGFSGDGGPATAAQLTFPTGVAVTADGGFLIADQSNQRVRRVSPAGTITTVAGDGTTGSSGDNGPATAAQLNFPAAMVATADGGFLIADQSNRRVRRVSPGGTITTVAGDGTTGSSGDGGPATAAQLDFPTGVAASADGGYLIADQNANRVRRVSPAGTITTVAGDGSAGPSGDGGPATAAQLNFPFGVAATAGGGFLISDFGNNRVRFVDADLRPGPQGATGPQGPAGPGGQQGPPGAQGPGGTNGTNARLFAALASERYTVRRGKRLSTRYVITTDAAVAAVLRPARGGRRTARLKSTRAKAGRHSLKLRVPRSTRPGRYTLVLTATAKGTSTTDRATVTVRR